VRLSSDAVVSLERLKPREEEMTMAWPPAGSGPVDIVLYYWILWLLLIAGPVAVWIAIYYLWLKPRWEPHFTTAAEAQERDKVS